MKPAPPQTGAREQPQPRWVLLIPLLIFAGCLTLAYGTARACAPSPETIILAPLEIQPGQNLQNPRLAEMLTTASLQRYADPVTITAPIHHASYSGLRDRLRLAAAAHSWHVISPGQRTSTTISMVVPQADLHLLKSLETHPEQTAQAISDAQPRPPSPGPLLTVAVQPDRYWTPATSATIMQLSGAAALLLALVLACTLRANP